MLYKIGQVVFGCGMAGFGLMAVLYTINAVGRVTESFYFVIPTKYSIGTVLVLIALCLAGLLLQFVAVVLKRQ